MFKQKLYLKSTVRGGTISLTDLKCDIRNTARSEQTGNSNMVTEMFNSSKKSGKRQNSVKCVLFFSPSSSVIGALHASQVPLLTSTGGVIGSVRAAAGEPAEPRQTQVRAAAVVGAVIIG